MIDHVSIAVSDLARSARFYEPVLAALGLEKIVDRDETIGFGKSYPEFWLNSRPDMAKPTADCGIHICLRASRPDLVDAFWKAAVDHGGLDDGRPGVRPEYNTHYYAAFIKDPDGNRIEVVNFLPDPD